VLALLTEEQEFLRDVVRDLARSIGLRNPADLAVLDRGKGWAQIDAAGLLALRAREDGRPAASGVEVMIVAEALAARLVPQPYLGTALLPAELLAHTRGAAELQASVSAGATRACVLLAPDLAVPAPSTVARPAAWDCEGAEVALGLDLTSGTVTCHRIDALEPVPAADYTRTVAAVTTGTALATYEVTPEGVDRWLAFALVAVSADIVGAMRGALGGAVDYAKERVQFGVAIGSFQAVQHLCAEMLVKIEGAASTLKYAAWAVDELDPVDALRAARTAKAYAAGIARDVGETVMQVYGGIGQTWEHVAHFFLRRQMVSALVLGDEPFQLRALAAARFGAVA
jgi:alkylation response protein AidB-like acyl-CoA dehydrogenase